MSARDSGATAQPDSSRAKTQSNGTSFIVTLLMVIVWRRLPYYVRKGQEGQGNREP